MRTAILLVAAAAAAWGQSAGALLAPQDATRLCLRASQLMEAGGVAVADLSRAGAPMIENVRQACAVLGERPGAGQPTYTVLMNLRAYLGLADTVPKPFPFPEAARLQFAELRELSNQFDAHFRAALDAKDAQLRSPDPNNLARYAEQNRATGLPKAGNARVVFLGDSITDLWRLNEYFPGRDFINRGIAGQSSGELLGRMKADVMDLHAEVVVIQAGTFDLARDIPLTAIENNYLMMADLAAASKIKVIFGPVLPVSPERSKERPLIYIRALNDWLRSLCASRGYVYVDYSAALSDASGQLIADLSDDGLLPNAKGYRMMAPLLLEAVAKAAPPPAQAPGKPSRKPKARPEASN